MKEWKAVGVVIEGQPIYVAGLNPWSLEWHSMHRASVELPHPTYPHQRHLFTVYEVESAGKRITFAAGELSANGWGFYVPATSPGPIDLSTRLRGIYESVAAGDPRAMAEFLADDVIYHLPGKHLGGGTLHGRVEVLERAARAALDCDSPPSIKLISVIASGEFAVSLEQFTVHRRGRMLDQEVGVVWRIARDHCVEIWSYFSDQSACDLFWQEAT